jgi:hypothetical protein
MKSMTGDKGESKTASTAELFVNLYNSPTALLVQLGTGILAYDIYRALSSVTVSPFTGHPAFNSLGLALLLQGVLLVQPAPRNADIKNRLGFVHGIFNNLAVLSFLVGSGFIFYNKNAYGAQHYTTWHAWLGLTTYTTLVTVALFGNSVYFFPVQIFGSINKAKSFYKYHRQFGYLTLIMIGSSIFLATYSAFNESTLHIGRGLVLLCLGLIAGGLIPRVDVKKMGF